MVFGVVFWLSIAAAACAILIYSHVCDSKRFKRINVKYTVLPCDPCEGKGYYTVKHVTHRCTVCSGHGVREVY
jgi:hypothetical protein